MATFFNSKRKEKNSVIVICEVQYDRSKVTN